MSEKKILDITCGSRTIENSIKKAAEPEVAVMDGHLVLLGPSPCTNLPIPKDRKKTKRAGA